MPTASRLVTTGLVADSSPTGERFELAVSSRTAADGHFRFVWTLDGGKRGPGEHLHEDESETFEVVSGVLRIWIGDAPRDLHPGDTVTVPPRVPHRFLNPGTTPVVVNVALSGPRMEDLLVPLAVATGGRKPGVKHLFGMMVGLDVHRSSTATSAISRGLLRLLAGAARLFGVRAGEAAMGWDRASTAG